MTELTAARVFSDPPLGGTLPGPVRITADGAYVLYLANPPDDRERQDLFAYRVADGSTSRIVDASTLSRGGELTDAEKAERERRRQFGTGISRFTAAPDGTAAYFLLDGAVWRVEIGTGTTRCLVATGRQTELTCSPSGRHLSYVRSGDLFVFDVSTGRERRITSDASETVASGAADFIAQEEMHRFEGHWWSPDDRFLAFTRVDSAAIPLTQRYEFRADGLVVVGQRYPYAGSANARIELRVFDRVDGAVRTLPWAHAPDDYLARVGWAGARLWVQAQDRAQTALRLRVFDVRGGGPSVTRLIETSAHWIELHDNLHVLPNGRDFLWTSSDDGIASLYLYRDIERETGERTRLTRGVRVTRVVRADATHADFLGWVDAPIERHLFRVAFAAPEELERLTTAAGWHDVTVAPDGRWFADRHANVRTPSHVDFVKADRTREKRPIIGNRLDDTHPYASYAPRHVTPEFGTLESVDGQTLWYRLTPPADRQPGQRYPVLVQVYGGPGVQRVVDDWPPLTLQLYAQAGFAVFELDNRGGGNRETRFETALHAALGSVEVEDQLRGVAFLRTLDWVDPARIGVFGGSYGGYMTLLCLAKGNGAFRAGASLAPVTDWRLYDTHYTERYLGTPQQHPDRYSASGVFAHLDGLRGELLLMHGMADDNVLFEHSSRLMLELQRRGIPFELMLYPGAKHAMQERHVAIHRTEALLRFFRRTLA
jgi:dipeptidyl-peptidase-4